MSGEQGLFDWIYSYFLWGLPIVLILPLLIVYLLGFSRLSSTKLGKRFLMNGYASLVMADFIKDKSPIKNNAHSSDVWNKIFVCQRGYFKSICNPLDSEGHPYTLYLFCLLQLEDTKLFKKYALTDAIKEEISMAYESTTRGFMTEWNDIPLTNIDVQAITVIYTMLLGKHPNAIQYELYETATEE